MGLVEGIILVIAIIVAIASAVMMLTMKKPKVPDTTKQFEAPTTEVGTIIPVLFGTKIQKAPLLPWYGDVEIVKVKVDMAGKK